MSEIHEIINLNLENNRRNEFGEVFIEVAYNIRQKR